MTKPPTPQMPKPDFTRQLRRDYPREGIATFACYEIPVDHRHARGTTTFEQFAQDVMEERDQYRNAIQEGLAMSGGEFTGIPRKDINTIVRDQVALQKADRVEELEKALRMIKDQRMGCGGNLTTDQVLKAIERIAEQALTNPGEKGAEG